MTPAHTWVDLGFYAIDHAVPIITAIGSVVAAIGTVVAAILGFLNKQHLAKQDTAIETVRQDVNSANTATITADELAAKFANAVLATPLDHPNPKPE